MSAFSLVEKPLFTAKVLLRAPDDEVQRCEMRNERSAVGRGLVAIASPLASARHCIDWSVRQPSINFSCLLPTAHRDAIAPRLLSASVSGSVGLSHDIHTTGSTYHRNSEPLTPNVLANNCSGSYLVYSNNKEVQ